MEHVVEDKADEEEKKEESIRSVVVDGTKKRKRSVMEEGSHHSEAKPEVEAPIKQENVKQRKVNPPAS